MSIKKITKGQLVESELPVKNKINVLTKVLFILLTLALVALLASLLSHHNMTKKIARLSTVEGQKAEAKKEIDELVKKVSRLILLPNGETPTIATITDATELAKNQPFYLGSNSGDKVLIYFKAQRAYIYNPTKDILVNVGPVYLDKNTQINTTSINNTSNVNPAKLTIEVRNGTATNGKATDLGNKIKSMSDYTVASISDAVTTTYKNTLLIDLSQGDKNNLIQSLAKFLNVNTTSTLPFGEKPSQAEALIIIGKN